MPPSRKKPLARRLVSPVVAAVVKPVAARLSRIETLIMELRFDQAIQLKRVTDLQVQLDAVAEDARISRAHIGRLSRRK